VSSREDSLPILFIYRKLYSLLLELNLRGAHHRNHISRMRIQTVAGFFTVQSNGAGVVGNGKEEKCNFFNNEMF
jgi:hypothetical protein